MHIGSKPHLQSTKGNIKYKVKDVSSIQTFFGVLLGGGKKPKSFQGPPLLFSNNQVKPKIEFMVKGKLGPIFMIVGSRMVAQKFEVKKHFLGMDGSFKQGCPCHSSKP